MIRNLSSLLLVALLVIACSGTEEPAQTTDKFETTMNQRERHLVDIDSLEAEVYSDTMDLNAPEVGQLLQSYLDYSEKYPGDIEKTPEFLYKSAALCRATGVPVKALKIYSQLLSDYPNFIRNSEAAFLLAFTYDEDLNQLDLAEEAYQEVIDKYPGDIWAAQAEERLKTLGMSDEELIEMFMKKNQSGAASE
jgi:tetratricopeptide (TPR) repeat protein